MREHTLRAASLWLLISVTVACAKVEPDAVTAGSFGDDDDDVETSSSSGGSSGGPSGSSSGGSGTSGGSSGVAGGTLAAGDDVWTIEAAGKSRSIRVHVPASVTDHALPVVIALHGNGDSASSFEATSGLRDRADAIGFVLLTPDGIERDIVVGGNVAPSVPWDAYNLYPDNWDLQLLTALRERVQATGSIANDRVSMYGFSQGGYMAYRAAEALSADFSCAAVLSASDPSGYKVPFTRPIPISLLIGTSDYGIDEARVTDQALTQAGHEHHYEEITGLGHALAPAPKRFDPLDYCLDKSL
jgi:poly(3-hydroxybutyrate) depolymerase